MRSLLLAPVALLAVALALAAPASTLATDAQVKLGLTPVGQHGPYFDLIMKPGETRTLDVDILDAGDAPLAARTYAADVYTIVNGGFGGRLRGEAQTGMTRWLDYPTDVLDLRPGETVRRSFTVAVPATAKPGEYIASLVLENDRPITGAGAIAFDQVVRQAVAVVVTVPGRRTPALVIGDATYTLAATGPIVSVAVANTGNVRLKPVVSFTLFDPTGAAAGQASVPMDTFYAATATSVEMPLAQPLGPGAWTVRVTLDDAAQHAGADRSDIPFTVTAAPVERSGPDLPGVIKAIADESMALPSWAIVLLAGVLLGLIIGLSTRRARRRGRTVRASR